jgi:hypothetical protein
LGFAALVQAALLGTWVWTGLVSPRLAQALWAVLGVLWLAGALASWLCFDAPEAEARPAADDEGAKPDRFAVALTEYLRGHWFEAEAICQELVAARPFDAEARLLWASLLRHAGRRAEAAAQLEQLELLDGAAGWQWEILQERRLLAELEETNSAATGAEESHPGDDPEAAPASRAEAGSVAG